MAEREKLIKEIAETLAKYELLNIADCPSEEYAIRAATEIIKDKLENYILVRGDIL